MKIKLAVISLGLCVNFNANAWQGNYHGHGQEHVQQQHYHNHSNIHSHSNGWFNGPSLIINLPNREYYQPYCENVEVCNPYGYCWIEREYQ